MVSDIPFSDRLKLTKKSKVDYYVEVIKKMPNLT